MGSGGIRDVAGQITSTSGDGRTVHVRALTYNIPDTFQTSWKPGVLTDDIDSKLRSGRTIPVYWMHDDRITVGEVVGFADGRGALELTLRLDDPDVNPDAEMVRSILQEGARPGVSIRFDNGQSEPDPLHPGGRRFTRASLGEVSIVRVASVPGARVLGVRSADDDYQLEPDELAALDHVMELAELDRRAELALAKLTLGGFHRRATAGVRAAIELAERDARAEQQAAQERARVSRQLAAIDASSPDPHFVEQHFGSAESWSLNPDSAMPDYPPGDLIAVALDQGMTEAEAVAAWRRKYGKTDDGKRHGNVPGISEYPPQDIITAATAGGRMTAAEAIHRWRVKYGFEQA